MVLNIRTNNEKYVLTFTTVKWSPNNINLLYQYFNAMSINAFTQHGQRSSKESSFRIKQYEYGMFFR